MLFKVGMPFLLASLPGVHLPNAWPQSFKVFFFPLISSETGCLWGVSVSSRKGIDKVGINLLVRKDPQSGPNQTFRKTWGSEMYKGKAGQNGGKSGSLTHLVVHIKPLRVVVQLFRLKGHSCHEAKSLIKRRKTQTLSWPRYRRIA